MTQPNFFIVGAPKCGTTALSRYLQEHPQIFMCDPKEPHYFADDLPRHRYVDNLDAYQALFRPAVTQRIVGEASVGYLFSAVALSNIRAYNPEAKIIAMVRNPLEMALSLHGQLLYAAYEDETDFATAWHRQAERRSGLHIPPACRAPAFLQYAEVCRLGRQIERLLDIFPANHVKIIVFDDLAADTAAVYRDVLHFLGLPDDGRTAFARVNSAKRPRSRRLAQFVAKYKPLAVSWALRTQAISGLNILPLMKRLVTVNEQSTGKTTLAPALRAELATCFRDDVALLARLLQRDFSHWLTGSSH
ncbi:MAG: sulfotransferase [Methylococcaceae bacterium]|nr:MAG: sulfotransferase [Methylococcaceae bacterium]